jgi:hypothetical protein
MNKHDSEARTESVVLDLIKIQGWSLEKPPKGGLVRQNEFRNHAPLKEYLAGGSKTGKGDGVPDFIILDEQNRPLIIIEAKANKNDVSQAIDEACHYGNLFIKNGHDVICCGIAGQDENGVALRTRRFLKSGKWTDVTFMGNPITWIPTSADCERIRQGASELKPTIPSDKILSEKADIINRRLREAAINDGLRPAYVGAMMLAMWHTRGNIRKTADVILHDINNACKAAFLVAGKPALAESIRIDEANEKLKNTAWEILSILEKLNVVSAMTEHDYIGQLYEHFFRYTGGNTIGQYFTPRHTTRFMADLCDVTKTDKVIDPTCGTGGFLIACISRIYEQGKAKYEDVIKVVRDNLIGYESEPLTAALCVANMILRGDGKTGISSGDVFKAKNFPNDRMNVCLMNPPFPHKKTDTPSTDFIDKGLSALAVRGLIAAILPTSVIVKKEFQDWRATIMESHTLEAVCELPDETFQPYASTTTCIVLIRKGVPHSKRQKTVFVRVEHDGLTLKKGNRVLRSDGKNQIPLAIDCIQNKLEVPGFSGVVSIDDSDEWAPGAHIPSGIPDKDVLLNAVDDLIRRHAAFYSRYGKEIAEQRRMIDAGEIEVRNYEETISDRKKQNANTQTATNGAIGHYFKTYYGLKELHSRDGIAPGNTLIVSPTEGYNGTYGWLNFDFALSGPFITVAQTGSIGEAFVQTEACAPNDDCLILLPKKGVSIAQMFIAASAIRLEKWRFSYGRKLTPERIVEFQLNFDKKLEAEVDLRIKKWKKINESIIDMYK